MGWSKRRERDERKGRERRKDHGHDHHDHHDERAIDVIEVDLAPDPEAVDEPDPPTPTPATIARDIEVQGEIRGRGDVVVQGRVQGRIALPGHRLVVGPSGVVTAEVHAGSVLIEGRLIGNVTAEQRVEIAPGGTVEGDIAAGRVVLTDGARFSGRIDMTAEADDARQPAQDTDTDTKPGSDPDADVDPGAIPDVDAAPRPAFSDASDDALSFLVGS